MYKIKKISQSKINIDINNVFFVIFIFIFLYYHLCSLLFYYFNYFDTAVELAYGFE